MIFSPIVIKRNRSRVSLTFFYVYISIGYNIVRIVISISADPLYILLSIIVCLMSSCVMGKWPESNQTVCSFNFVD